MARFIMAEGCQEEIETEETGDVRRVSLR